MYLMGILKRVAPFVITFGIGLFIASFFVSIALPNIRPVKRWQSHREYHRKLEFENRQLKAENCRLKKEAAERRSRKVAEVENLGVNELVPPPPPIPVAPRAAR